MRNYQLYIMKRWKKECESRYFLLLLLSERTHTILWSLTIMISKYFISSNILRGICKIKTNSKCRIVFSLKSIFIMTTSQTLTMYTIAKLLNSFTHSYNNLRVDELTFVALLHREERLTARFFLRFSQDKSSSSEKSCSSSTANTRRKPVTLQHMC